LITRGKRWLSTLTALDVERETPIDCADVEGQVLHVEEQALINCPDCL